MQYDDIIIVFLAPFFVCPILLFPLVVVVVIDVVLLLVLAVLFSSILPFYANVLNIRNSFTFSRYSFFFFF